VALDHKQNLIAPYFRGLVTDAITTDFSRAGKLSEFIGSVLRDGLKAGGPLWACTQRGADIERYIGPMPSTPERGLKPFYLALLNLKNMPYSGNQFISLKGYHSKPTIKDQKRVEQNDQGNRIPVTPI